MVDCAAINHVQELYINSAHPVFDLVPPRFGVYLENCYKQMLRPLVDRHTVWTVYLDLLDEIRYRVEALRILETHTLHAISTATSSDHDDDELPLLVGLKDLHFDESDGVYYMGSVRGGLGLGKLLCFSWSNDHWCMFCTGEEHVHALDIMEEDEPVIDGNGLAIVLAAFSDDEIEDAEDAEDWWTH